jgi:hypothetical protein
VESLRRLSVELDHVWDNLDDRAWGQEVLEPADNPDLGTLRVSGLPLVRLTEVEVHGIDLDLGLDDWSDLFVRTALPARLGRLGTRRPNRGEVDHLRQGTLLLVATDGPTFTLSVNRDHVEAHPGDPMAPATAVIEATSRDLLALLLGRPLVGAPRIAGDETFIDAFRSAFPGP